MNTVVLSPVIERVDDYDDIFWEILGHWKQELYVPLLKEIGAPTSLLNAIPSQADLSALADAIQAGRIRFWRGRFTGRFSSKLSRALRSIGAEWDRKHGCFVVPHSSLPIEIQAKIAASNVRFQRVASRMVDLLSATQPEQVASRLDLTSLMDRTVFKVDGRVRATLKEIKVVPALTADQRKRIATEYTENMQLWIQDWTAREITALRKRIIDKSILGFRYEDMVKEIERSYGASHSKARFLARQETSLFMSKFKQVRYQECGSDEYFWACVAGSSEHPVRPFHKRNDGKRFRWDTGAVINAQGERRNPGQDYGCRCYTRPIVRF